MNNSRFGALFIPPLFFLVFSNSATILAQQDLGLEFFQPRLNLTLNRTGESELGDSKDTYRNSSANLSATLPLWSKIIKEGEDRKLFRTLLSVHGGVGKPEISFLKQDRSFYSGGLSVTALMVTRERNFYSFTVGTSFSEDDTTIHHIKPRYSAMGLATHRSSEKFSLQYGGAFAYTFGQGRVFPIFGFNWRASDKWSLNALLPLNFRLTYKATQQVRLSWRLGISGGRFRMANQGQYFDAPETLNLRMTQGVVDFGIHVRGRGSIGFEARAGFLAGGRLSIVDDHEKEFEKRNMGRNGFVHLSTTIRLGKRSSDSLDQTKGDQSLSD